MGGARQAGRVSGEAAAQVGTVLICTGRSEFIEKYCPVVAELQQRGFAVVVFDWRGQGLSQRPLRDAQKGHVAHFSDYEGDLLAVVDQVLAPFCPKPWFGLAHSMGGAIALNAAADRPDLFRRLVLSAPMVEIARLPFKATARGRGAPLPLRGARDALRARRARARHAVPRLRGQPPHLGRGALPRGARLHAGRAAPDARRPDPGLAHAAFTAMARLQADDYPERMRTPVLAVVPGFDLVVEPRATERLVTRLRASRVVTVPGSRHEILMERDGFRRQFWAAFDAFVPGSE